MGLSIAKKISDTPWCIDIISRDHDRRNCEDVSKSYFFTYQIKKKRTLERFFSFEKYIPLLHTRGWLESTLNLQGCLSDFPETDLLLFTL